MPVEIPIRVHAQSIKDASKAADQLKEKLSGLGSMDVPIHARMDSTNAIIAQQNRTLLQEMNRFFRQNPVGGAWSQGPGNRIYTSPGGTQYNYTGGAGGSVPSPSDESTNKNLFMGAGRFAVAALGIGTALSWWNNSKESASRFETSSALLRVRGGGISDDILRKRASIGSGPLEQAQIYDELLSKTGVQGKHLDNLTGMASLQGLLTGVGSQSMARYYSGMFSSIKETSQPKIVDGLNTAAMRLFDASKALGAVGRYGEVLTLNQKLLATISTSRGGEGLTDKEISAASAMQMSLWNTGKIGQGASGVSLLEKLNSGIQSGGSDPGSQIFFARSLGVHNVKTMADLWRYKERQARGASPENLNAVFTEADKIIKARGIVGDEATAMRKHFISGAFPAMSPFQVNAITQPEFRGVIGQLAGSNNKGAWSSILKTAIKQNPEAFQGMSEKDIFRMLGLETMKADAESQVTDLTTIGRPALRATNTSKDLKNIGKRGVTDAVIKQKGLFTRPPVPGMDKIDVRSMSAEELQNSITYMQGTGAYPDKLKELMTIQREQKGDSFNRGADLSYLPGQFAAELSRQALTLRSDGGIMEITSRLDSLLSAVAGNGKAPVMKRWIQEGMR